MESVGKNTASAIALGTIKAKLIEKDPILLILAAGRFIQDVYQFIEILKKGVDYAEKGNIEILLLNQLLYKSLRIY